MVESEPTRMLFFSVLFAVLSYALYRRSKRLPAPYPPGPPAKPIIGNAFDIPFKKPWVKYAQWAKEFNSSIIHLSTMNSHIVVLQTKEDIVELLERRSAKYSSRMSSPIFELVGMDTITPFLSYGNTLRKHRKLLDEAIKKDLLASYNHIQVQRVHILLDQLLHDPDGFTDHCKMLGTSITLAIAYGYDLIPERKDQYVELTEFAVNTAQQLLTPGATFISVFPFLKYIPTWIPGASTQKLCAKVQEASMEGKKRTFDFVKRNMTAGTSKHCALKTLLERRIQKDGSYEDEDVIKEAMSGLYFAGVETIQTTQTDFILAMTLHPHIQKKAQEEIDLVVGPDRLPTYIDRPSLPYVEAVYREVLRWQPIGPLGLPHSTDEDDIYKGFYIPKGTVVMPNVWAITRDATKYPEPELFRPERFFNPDGTLNGDTVNYMFGFGRRICPGRHIAELTVWIMIVSVLATFNISRAKDEDGNDIDVDADAFTDTLVMHPLPFKCTIVPRSKQAELRIHEAATVAKENLENIEQL